MSDRELLDDLIAKLHEMQEQLSMAQLEAAQQSLLATRVRHLSILAVYERNGLQNLKESRSLPETKADETRGRA